MITEIPSASDFEMAGMNQLYLAWQISMQAISDYESAEDYVSAEDREAAEKEYWAKSQPALANAFALIQQAMEMALKGRIATISPYLLISKDPKDWPKGVDTQPTPFSDFRTLDAADLVKVHDSFAPSPLDERFRIFWDEVRRDRNRIMHSVSVRSFDPATLVRTLLTAAHHLFSDLPWPQRLQIMQDEGKYAAFGFEEGNHNIVLSQIDIAVRYLTPAENRLHFGFDRRRRSYLCPHCYYISNRDWQDVWPKLAQFPVKQAGSCQLSCFVCNETSDVERRRCNHFECEADVIFEGMCLSCLRDQDSPYAFHSTLSDDGLGAEFLYALDVRDGSSSISLELRFPDDGAAIEHARLMLLARDMEHWDRVTIRHIADTNPTLSRGRLLGTWKRSAVGLTWVPDFAPGFLAHLDDKQEY
jgi:hypothetical protein